MQSLSIASYCIVDDMQLPVDNQQIIDNVSHTLSAIHIAPLQPSLITSVRAL